MWIGVMFCCPYLFLHKLANNSNKISKKHKKNTKNAFFCQISL